MSALGHRHAKCRFIHFLWIQIQIERFSYRFFHGFDGLRTCQNSREWHNVAMQKQRTDASNILTMSASDPETDTVA